MTKQLSEFSPVEGAENVYSAQRGTLRCVAIRLKRGGLCLYSPVAGLGDAALSSLGKLGRVTSLLAPNHYHHKAVVEYVDAFPDAHLVCSAAARPRLQKVTGLAFEAHEGLEDELPEPVIFRRPDGLKTGELWLRAKVEGGFAWIVTDAFSGPNGKAGEISDKLQLLGTFPSYGIKDAAIYKSWVKQELHEAPPQLIVPCHGSMVRSQHLAEDLSALVDKLD